MVIRNFADVKVHIRTEDILKENVIYRLTFPNGKFYIGQTVKKLNERIRRHCNDAFNKNFRTFNLIKSRAIRKYMQFGVDILYQGDNLDEEEIKFIEMHQSTNPEYGYNSTSGGQGIRDFKLSDEKKKQLSEKLTGEGNPFYGKSHTDATKELISKSRMNKGIIPILQIDSYGNVIKEWNSTKEAGESLNLDRSAITKVLKGKLKSTKGYIFRYKN